MGNQACCAGVEEPKVIYTAAGVAHTADGQKKEGGAAPRPTSSTTSSTRPTAKGRREEQLHLSRDAFHTEGEDRAETPPPEGPLRENADGSTTVREEEAVGLPPCNNKYYQARLDKTSSGGALGLDVDFLSCRPILPITALREGASEKWNKAHPYATLEIGDSIVEVNGCSGDARLMVERCQNDDLLELKMRTQLTYAHLVADLETLVDASSCGPILIRSCWHDNGYVPPKAKSCLGYVTTAASSADSGERKPGSSAGAGLLDVAAPLLSNIKGKYYPILISHADLLVLAANVSIRKMGGPIIKTRFGRVDATSSAAPPTPQQGGPIPHAVDHLGWIFSAEDLTDKDVVALSGAKCIGRYFEGTVAAKNIRFDNSYFRELLASPHGPDMLETDLELLEQPKYSKLVEMYAADQDTFYTDFAKSWTKLQERGCSGLGDVL